VLFALWGSIKTRVGVTPTKQVDKMRRVWYNNNKEKCVAVLDFAFQVCYITGGNIYVYQNNCFSNLSSNLYVAGVFVNTTSQNYDRTQIV